MTKNKKISEFNQQYTAFDIEEIIIKYWKENHTFEKSVANRSEKDRYTFYDGPPFITGLPHYGHLLGSIIKDVVPRYQTMKGKRVERVWGWDCHGLPAENKVEQQLGLKSKKDIEDLGVDKFVSACKNYVNNVSAEWEWYIDHIGRWVDFKNAYKTMDKDYMETVIWVFKQLHDKKLIYKGKRVSLFCPRCSTPISNFEVAMDNSYKDVTDPSVFIKFKLKNETDTFILAWTTTPWTLPSNYALAIDEKAEYVKVEINGENIILAKSRLDHVITENYQLLSSLKGKDLVGLEYEPLYNYFSHTKEDYKVYPADFVSMDDGTGVVHVAPGFGEDDTALGQKYHLSSADSVDDTGNLVPEITVAQGKFFKQADKLIIADLIDRNILFKQETIVHSYPHCHRCATPLIYKSQVAWYIDIQSLKSNLLKTNEDINWIPKHFKQGRFKQGIDTAPDWCISRTRYWGTPMPVWECDCGYQFVAGSIAEIESASGQKIIDLHRPDIDEVEVTCPHCQKKIKRIKDVLDCWVESASMPYAQLHYPFENQEKFKNSFPGDFITEYTGQLRAWFYVMHVISNALYGTESFKNCLVSGVIMGNDGRKMSKNYGNYPDPKISIEKYGADALRLYIMSIPVVSGEDVAISEIDWQEQSKSFLMMLWNSYKFFANYAALDQWEIKTEFTNPPTVLDSWILTRLDETIINVNKNLSQYQLPKSVTELKSFVNDLSTWYIRRSRDRVGPSTINQQDKEIAYTTFYTIFSVFLKILAPFAPFISDYLYQHLTGEDSVHLTDWPEVNNQKVIDKKILEQMVFVRQICELGHSSRKQQSIAVKQPLAKITVHGNIQLIQDSQQLLKLIKDELNVEAVELVESAEVHIQLDTDLTQDLLDKGKAREIIREIQEARKKAGCKLDEYVDVSLPQWPASQENWIKQQTLVTNITVGETLCLVRK